MKTIKQLKSMMKSKRKATSAIPAKDFLSTGATQLNLAFSGRTSGGIPKGFFFLWVGRSSTGKTVTGLTILAEAANNPSFDGYDILFNNIEGGATMDLVRYYGQTLVDRMEDFRTDTIEEFHSDIRARLKKGKPFVMLVDSMDGLYSTEEASPKVGKDGKEKGSFGVSRAKLNSTNFRIINNGLKKTGSILIIISQTRQNIGFGAQFNPDTRSGGEALHFYNRLEVWTKVKEKIRVGKRQIGRKIKVTVVKNHINGWEGEVTIPLYRSVGLDDTGNCIDYLIDEGHWKETNKTINAVEFDVKKKREALVAHIEATDQEGVLKKIVAKRWHEVEDSIAIKRKKRYK